jgi:hypothetical protein
MKAQIELVIGKSKIWRDAATVASVKAGIVALESYPLTYNSRLVDEAGVEVLRLVKQAGGAR